MENRRLSSYGESEIVELWRIGDYRVMENRRLSYIASSSDVHAFKVGALLKSCGRVILKLFNIA